MLILLEDGVDLQNLEVLIAAVLMQALGLLVEDHEIDAQFAQSRQLLTLFNQTLFALALDGLAPSLIHDECFEGLLLWLVGICIRHVRLELLHFYL